uniref:SH3 domain-containing protein n=1 Tax=Loa loa TaxID=7209 RepID=A0A1I7W4U8_LOALO
MLRYSKSIRSRTQSLYRDAKRRFNKSFRSHHSTERESGHNEGCVAVDDFKASEKGQLSVTKGQRLEVVEYCGDAPEWVLVSITWENGEQQRGLVPCSMARQLPAQQIVPWWIHHISLMSLPRRKTSSKEKVYDGKYIPVDGPCFRRFFSNGQQQQQGLLSGSHSRPQSVSLATRKSNGQQLRHSAADPLHSGCSSSTDQQDHLLPRDLVESDLTVVSTTSTGGAHSVLSSCDDQTNLTTEHGEASTAGGLLSVNPPLIDPTVESTASFSDQAEFELPPPMSELSSAVADAAASRNTSLVTIFSPFSMVYLQEVLGSMIDDTISLGIRFIDTKINYSIAKLFCFLRLTAAAAATAATAAAIVAVAKSKLMIS